MYYTAPEVLRGEAFYLQSDVWSFGISFWECLTGRPAYDDRHTPGSIIIGIGSGKLRLAVPRRLPPDVRQLLARILSFDYRQRPLFPEVHAVLSNTYHATSTVIAGNVRDLLG